MSSEGHTPNYIGVIFIIYYIAAREIYILIFCRPHLLIWGFQLFLIKSYLRSFVAIIIEKVAYEILGEFWFDTRDIVHIHKFAG
jgi:hypothetical protein